MKKDDNEFREIKDTFYSPSSPFNPSPTGQKIMILVQVKDKMMTEEIVAVRSLRQQQRRLKESREEHSVDDFIDDENGDNDDANDSTVKAKTRRRKLVSAVDISIIVIEMPPFKYSLIESIYE